MPPNLHRLRVQTLDGNGLTDASAELAAKVGAFKPDTFKPDLLIGIRSGGYAVAEAMAPRFPEAILLPMTCRRPSTKKKHNSSALKNVLRRLPESFTSCLRILEHVVLTQLRTPERSVFVPNREELALIRGLLRQHKNPNILIVDDAVDSGATLAAVVEIIKNIAGPDATVKTAVITVTTASPFIEPDYSLYRYVLCRFPWSFDFKS